MRYKYYAANVSSSHLANILIHNVSKVCFLVSDNGLSLIFCNEIFLCTNENLVCGKMCSKLLRIDYNKYKISRIKHF